MKLDVPWLVLPEGFEFCAVETDDELEEIIRFNRDLHDPWDGDLLRRFIEHLPDFRRDLNFYIRDTENGMIVSSMNAIPCTWTYAGIPLRNLEMGFVGTLPEYQRRGFFNILYNYFEHLLIEGQYDLSSIQGIPFFYRKYGYDFILPLDRTITLDQASIPSLAPDSIPSFMDITLRESTAEDIPKLMELYSISQARLLVTAVRDERLWRAQESIRMSEDKPIRTLLLDNNDRIEGYFRVGERRDRVKDTVEAIIVKESSILSYDSVMRTLHFLKDAAQAANTSVIEIPGNRISNLGQIALDYGGIMQRGWKYQIRIPNLLNFLNKIRPVLEMRLKSTMYEGITREIAISTYRNCYLLKFIEGTLEPIEDLGMQPTRSRYGIRMPPQDLVRLILGDYSIHELGTQNIDFIVRPGRKHFLETLFPKQDSYLYSYQF
ncbi:MAG: GNAT family N-acetyltransferase [Candidatus Thorarchaeota archaeon]